jgi:hypothetical protein
MFRAPTSAYVTIDSLRRATNLRPVFEGASGVVFAPSMGTTPASDPSP